MRIGTGSLPFHAARAYAASAPVGADVAARSGEFERRREDIVELTPGAAPSPAAALVGARVGAGLDLDDSGAAPASARGALPMYTRPADRNAAATGVLAGRVLDVSA